MRGEYSPQELYEIFKRATANVNVRGCTTPEMLQRRMRDSIRELKEKEKYADTHKQAQSYKNARKHLISIYKSEFSELWFGEAGYDDLTYEYLGDDWLQDTHKNNLMNRYRLAFINGHNTADRIIMGRARERLGNRLRIVPGTGRSRMPR